MIPMMIANMPPGLTAIHTVVKGPSNCTVNRLALPGSKCHRAMLFV
jgi:hypothetical protein